MKILKENNTIRLLMRREQVHKVCCNHQLLKNMSFSKMSNCAKALSWFAQDFSEEVLKAEMFAIRFKTEEQADAFLKAVTSAQDSLNDDNALGKKVKQPARNQHAKLKVEAVKSPEPKPDVSLKLGWGDKFKPKLGSWNCKNCYITNEAKDNYCIACETPKNESIPKDSQKFQFIFGATQPKQEATKTATSGFGDAFKPKEGSWQCDTCYVNNDGSKQYCISCESPRDANVPKKEQSKGVNLDTPGLKFNFGIPSATATSQTGAATKPAATFSFGSQLSTGFSFGAKPSETGKEPFSFKPADVNKDKKSPVEGSEKDQFVFGSPQKHAFDFTPR